MDSFLFVENEGIDDSIIEDMQDNHFVFVSPNPVKITTYTDSMHKEYIAILFTFCNSDGQYLYDFDFHAYNDKTIEWENLNQIGSSFEEEYGELLDNNFKTLRMDYVDEFSTHNRGMYKLDCLRFYFHWKDLNDNFLNEIKRGITRVNRGLYDYYQRNFKTGMDYVATKDEWLKKPFFVQ